MKTAQKFLQWSPRVLGILAIAFISLFALDAFDPVLSWWDQLLAFAIHMIPSFILLIILLIAWRRELTGGLIFIVIGLIFTPWVFGHNLAMNNNVLMTLGIVAVITFPFVLTGVLFVLSWRLKSKHRNG